MVVSRQLLVVNRQCGFYKIVVLPSEIRATP